jgi:hypothetical protein
MYETGSGPEIQVAAGVSTDVQQRENGVFYKAEGNQSGPAVPIQSDGKGPEADPRKREESLLKQIKALKTAGGDSIDPKDGDLAIVGADGKLIAYYRTLPKGGFTRLVGSERLPETGSGPEIQVAAMKAFGNSTNIVQQQYGEFYESKREEKLLKQIRALKTAGGDSIDPKKGDIAVVAPDGKLIAYYRRSPNKGEQYKRLVGDDGQESKTGDRDDRTEIQILSAFKSYGKHELREYFDGRFYR